MGLLDFAVYNGYSDGTYTYPAGYDPNGDTLSFQTPTGAGVLGTFNISAIPEPATWAVMLLGIAFIGAAMRTARRRDGMSGAAA